MGQPDNNDIFDTKTSNTLTDEDSSIFISELPPSARVNSLREAMASADLRIALEELEEDQPLEPGSREADLFARTLEAELERNIGSEEDDWRERHAERTIDRVNTDLQQACSEIAREAQVNLRINQLVRERDREVRSHEQFGGPAANKNLPEHTDSPLATAISRRRLLLFCLVAALAGAGAAYYGLSGHFENSTLQTATNTVDSTPQVIGKTVEEDTRVIGASASSGPLNIARASAANTDRRSTWREGLGDRLGPTGPAEQSATPAKRALQGTVTSDPSNSQASTADKAEPIVKETARLIPQETASTRAVPAETNSGEPEATASIDKAEPDAATENASPVRNAPRSPQLVETALASTRGLDDLAAPQRDTLKNKLVEGECLTTALGAVFVKVPVLAMRDLVLNLESEC